MQTWQASAPTRELILQRVFRAANWVMRSDNTELPIDQSQVQRILIVKPCCIGDLLMATPAIRAVSDAIPGASIDILTGDWSRPAIETNSRIRSIIESPETLHISDSWKLSGRIRDEDYDLGISLDRSPLSSLLLRLAGIPLRAGINSSERGIGLTHRTNPVPLQHETDLYLSVIQSLGLETDSVVPEYEIPDDARAKGLELVPERSTPVVVIHPGGAVNPGTSMFNKRWPAPNFGELASLLVRELGATIVLVGGETDRDAASTVRDFARTPVVDLSGQLSMPELAALCSRAALYIGNDSGMTHLAAAVGTPTVTIFGPTNPNRYRPLGAQSLVCAPDQSWALPDNLDLRNLPAETTLPDTSDVPLPTVFGACRRILESR